MYGQYFAKRELQILFEGYVSQGKRAVFLPPLNCRPHTPMTGSMPPRILVESRRFESVNAYVKAVPFTSRQRYRSGLGYSTLANGTQVDDMASIMLGRLQFSQPLRTRYSTNLWAESTQASSQLHEYNFYRSRRDLNPRLLAPQASAITLHQPRLQCILISCFNVFSLYKSIFNICVCVICNYFCGLLRNVKQQTRAVKHIGWRQWVHTMSAYRGPLNDNHVRVVHLQ